MLTKYLNLSKKSGVNAYEIGSDYIIVQFIDKCEYLYNYIKPGNFKTERMKSLAKSGRGLNTYISKEIKKNFFKKLK